MKKLISFLALSSVIFCNFSFAAKQSKKKEKKIVVSQRQQSINISASAKPVPSASKQTSAAGTKGKPPKKTPTPPQTKTGVEKKTVEHPTVGAESATSPKIGVLKKAFIAAKYAVEKYDPSDAIAAKNIDKIEALNTYTQDILMQKASKYFTSNPRVNKKDAIKGFIETFASNHFETYKTHYLAIEKDYATSQKKIKIADVRKAFNDALALIKFRLEDEYVSCECTIM